MRYVVLLMLPFLLLSCAQKKLVPLGNGIEVDPKTYTAIYEDENVRIVVRANAWEGYPSDLSSYVVPLYIEMLNRSNGEIWINFKDMLLLDEKGNQYNALSPKEAAEVAKEGARVGVSLGFSYGTPWWGLGWWAPAYTGDEGSDVVKYALIPGRIEPGSKIRGVRLLPTYSRRHQQVHLQTNLLDRGKTGECKISLQDRKGWER